MWVSWSEQPGSTLTSLQPSTRQPGGQAGRQTDRVSHCGASYFQSSSTPDEWEDFSNKNILKAERENNSAINLRSIIDGLLIQTLDDLQAQCKAVNLAFEKRIEETLKAKTKLEDHLEKVLLSLAEVNGVGYSMSSHLSSVNLFTPKSDPFQISRSAWPEV